MKEQPIETIPKDRAILIKHNYFGWLEAKFNEQVYNQSLQEHGAELGGFGWSSPGFDDWLYHKDITAWAELPEESE